VGRTSFFEGSNFRNELGSLPELVMTIRAHTGHVDEIWLREHYFELDAKKSRVDPFVNSISRSSDSSQCRHYPP
jgi:hypothetical protein